MKKNDVFYYKSNRLQQIRGFYYSVQQGSISKAAKIMGLQQSSVSIQIQSLEKDLGVMFLDRNGPTFEITEEGNIFYNMISEHVEAFEILPQMFRDRVAEVQSKTLNIAANNVSMHYLIPDILKKCKDYCPDLRIKASMKNQDEALELLKSNSIQAFVGPTDFISNDFECKNIGSYEVVLIAHKNHPLITSKNFELSDIGKYETVRTFDSSFITVPFFEEILKRYKVQTYAEIEKIDWEILKSFVIKTDIFTIVSSLCLSDIRDQDIGFRSLGDFIPNMNYGIVVKKGQIIAPALQSFFK